MNTVLDLRNMDARAFFLKEESYCSLELPEYFSFQTLLSRLSKGLKGKVIKDRGIADSPKNFQGVNYTLLNNKDGKFAWRPFQLIHPALYVFLVHEITEENNWRLIQDRFKVFSANSKIECHSIPVAEENEKSDKLNQVTEWWLNVEQRSLELALEFNHLLHLDITDCYCSIYTHSIPWAIHTVEEAKKSENRDRFSLVGNSIDKHIQAMSYGQTNGIPQGSTLMDFIAEIVLGYGDSLLTDELNGRNDIGNYRIIRYRDDYRIFTESAQQSTEIAKVLSDVLSRLNFKINSAKTLSTEDLILGSLKPDKVHWIYNKRKTENIQKWLLQLTLLAKEFPNSGSLYKELKLFLNWLQFKDKSAEGLDLQNVDVLLSILTNLAQHNPRLYALVSASLSFIISRIEDKADQKEKLIKIKNKLSQLPNTSYLNIWLQRLTIPVDPTLSYSGRLCEKVNDRSSIIWNSEWLNIKFKRIVEEAEIVNFDTISKMEIRFSEKEVTDLGQQDKRYS